MWSFSCISLAPSCKMLIARKWSTFLCKNVNAVLVSFVVLLNIFTSSESDDFVLQGPQKEEKPVVVPGRRKEHKVGKIHFVEHRTALHLYHSFHRLWIFFVCMLQVQPLSLQLNIEMLLETDVMCLLRIEDWCHCYSVLIACWMFHHIQISLMVVSCPCYAKTMSLLKSCAFLLFSAIQTNRWVDFCSWLWDNQSENK